MSWAHLTKIDGVEVTTSVQHDAPPVTVRIMRGGQLVHEFTEPAPEDLPPTSPAPQALAA